MQTTNLPTLIRAGDQRTSATHRPPTTPYAPDDTRAVNAPNHTPPKEYRAGTSPRHPYPSNNGAGQDYFSSQFQHPGSSGTVRSGTLSPASPFWTDQSPSKRTEEANANVTASLHYLSPSQNPTSPMTSSPLRMEPRSDIADAAATTYTVTVDPLAHQGSRTFYEISVIFKGMEPQKVQKVRVINVLRDTTAGIQSTNTPLDSTMVTREAWGLICIMYASDSPKRTYRLLLFCLCTQHFSTFPKSHHDPLGMVACVT
jgi:hypothetical protein